MRARVALDGSDLARRRGAWDALSCLFLDTEVRDWLPGVATTLVDLGYSHAEIERIFLDEVTPVLHLNLKQVAGLWSGFDLDWLAGEIQKRGPAPTPRRIGRFRRLVYRIRAWPATGEFDALLQLFDDAIARPPQERQARARALSVLVATYFERPGEPPRADRVSRLVEGGHSDHALREMASDVRRIFAPLRLRTQDAAEAFGLQRIDALLADVSRAG